MPSPFPGMNPFLEGHLWPDVHNSLAYLISVQLTPRMPEAYIVHLNNYTVADTNPGEDIGIMYPDVEVLKRARKAEEPAEAYELSKTTAPTVVIPAIKPVDVVIPVIEIKDRKSNRLITAIELLSPVNKRKPGLEAYREKRLRLHEADVNLIEIDLLRRGERPFNHPAIPKSHYLITLVRAHHYSTEAWAVGLKDTLPVIPVPLLPPDKDTTLDLSKVLNDMYEQRAMDKSIDYTDTPPPPAFSKEELDWLKQQIEAQN